MYAQNKNRTYISDLPELEDLEPPGHYGSQKQQNNNFFQQRDHHTDIPDKYKNFIRTGMGPPIPESGMYSPSSSSVPPAEFFQSPPRPQYKVEEKTLDIPKVNILPSCIDIHEHVINCPICSRYYKTDNSIYIISIVVLCIICILLLKRVLDL